MIFDSLDKINKYISVVDYAKIKVFLDRVVPDMNEGEYPIDGDRIFARVMSYDTKEPQDCIIEAHKKYIDIQATIIGAEGIDIYDKQSLREAVEYEPKTDVLLFDVEKEDGVLARANNHEGYFCMVFPGEPHSPQQRINQFYRVKKFVIKLMA